MQTFTTKNDSRRRSPRSKGLVLIVVMVVIVLLSLGAYTFSEYMVIENAAATFHGKTVQARALADSGVEFVSVLLGDRTQISTIGLFHNPSLFQGHLLINSLQAGGRGRFTVIAPVEGDASARNVRFGLIDESSKLNLNTIASLMAASEALSAANGLANSQASGSGTEEEEGTGLANPLMGIPGMTLEISEAIFDWIDEDDDQRDNGAENEIYQSLTPPYQCKNDKLETLDELLLVRGVTPQLLFGEDANRNGLLDPNENDGALTAPLDNADGMLDRGWAAYLTVHSRELNLQTDRTPRIDVNSNTLSDVYDKLEDEMSEEVAKFVVAYRLFGPAPDASGTTPEGANPGGGSTPDQDLKKLAQSLGAAVAGRSGSVTRGGMDLSGGGKFQVKSIFDLLEVQVKGTIDGTMQEVTNPLTDNQDTVTQLMEKLATHGKDTYIEGRININQAHREVLIGLPNITEDIVHRIVSAQLRGAGGEPLSEADGKRSTTMWLYTDKILDLPTLRQLDPFITGKGDVFRMQVLGHFDSGGPVVRIEAIVDATQNPPQPIFFRDLTDLGRGYTLPQLVTK